METAPAPQKETTESEKRPWQVVEEDIAAHHELEKDITSPEEGKIYLEQGRELYKESDEAFNEQVKVRNYGKVGLEAVEEERAKDIGSQSFSQAEKDRLKELHDVQNGNLIENKQV